MTRKVTPYMCRRCSTPALAVPCKGHKCVYRKRRCATPQVSAAGLAEGATSEAVVCFKEPQPQEEIGTGQNDAVQHELRDTLPEEIAAGMADVMTAAIVAFKEPRPQEEIGPGQNEPVQHEILRALTQLCTTVKSIHETLVTLNENVVLQRQPRTTA